MAIASSAIEMRSPAVSSMSSSRPGGASVMACAWSIRSSVVSPIAETTTTTSLPSFLALTTRSATRFMCSAVATEEPPYFWTTRATGQQATVAGWTTPRTGCSAARSGATRRRRSHPGPPATSPARWSTGPRTSTGWSTRSGHGAASFARLADEVEALGAGDHLFFTDWRGDPDERLREDGPTVAELFTRASRRGVCVRGLVWRSHWDKLSFSKEENRALDTEVEHGGGEVILDQRVRRGGSHHQKFVVLRHRDEPSRDVAFAGGIDLCHSRRDDAQHRGDPQPQPMSDRYGDRPPWHDVQLILRGPTVGVLDTVFRERWDDPTSADVVHPIAWVRDRLH